jgi:IclR family pca regulon transcriptional regulator
LSTTERPRDRNFVQSLERGLAVIRALSVPAPGLTLADVAREAGLTRASARRFLLTLEEVGYVRSVDRRFSLTPRVLELGYSFLSSLTLPEIAQPHLRELVERVHESSSVCVLDGSDVVYVARGPTQRIMTVAISVGTRFAAHATSMGRVLLAELDSTELDVFLGRAELKSFTARTLTSTGALRSAITAVRKRGYAVVDQELEEGCVRASRDRAAIPEAINDASCETNALVEASPASSKVPTSSSPRSARTSVRYSRTAALPSHSRVTTRVLLSLEVGPQPRWQREQGALIPPARPAGRRASARSHAARGLRRRTARRLRRAPPPARDRGSSRAFPSTPEPLPLTTLTRAA